MMDISFDPRLCNWSLLEQKRLRACRLLQAWEWKSQLRPSFPLICCLMGGTGTGKSTIFNSLAGKVISEVSKRRPSTMKPKILAHESAIDALLSCPFLNTDAQSESSTGQGGAAIEVYRDLDVRELVLVDTPDFDSAELGHHLIADNFFLISDLIILVTSQEKYADLAGHQVSERALEWGKTVLFVMNKVASDAAYEDFRETLHGRGVNGEPVRIERIEPSPSLIPGLADRDGFKPLFAVADAQQNRDLVRRQELDALRQHTERGLQDLIDAFDKEEQRLAHVDHRISAIVGEVLRAMDERVDTVVSLETETHIRERLQELLRKYDILFVPRMLVRNTIKRAFSTALGWLSGQPADSSDLDEEKALRAADLKEVRSAAKLEPLEAAIAKLNLQVAELLCSDALTDDLCKIAQTEVPRWDHQKIRDLYDEAFPGVEQFLEREFQHLRDGLSGKDELRLYGTYTLWALLLITVETTVLAGPVLLEALLGTVIMPFIPKWVLDAKILDLLKDIGLRVEREHRETLRDIVHRQAELYSRTFSVLLPGEDEIRSVRQTRHKLKTAVRSR
jgi:hypothetical protein